MQVTIQISDNGITPATPAADSTQPSDVSPSANDGGAAPQSSGGTGNTNRENSPMTADGSVLTDIGGPPDWLKQTITGSEQATASQSSGVDDGTDGGAAPA